MAVTATDERQVRVNITNFTLTMSAWHQKNQEGFFLQILAKTVHANDEHTCVINESFIPAPDRQTDALSERPRTITTKHSNSRIA